MTNIALSHDQDMAVDLCTDMTERIVSVTGGAGTGKTTVLGKAYAALDSRHSIALCAPTGRAAKRIQELTQIPAKTIHRLLEFPTPEDGMEDLNEPKRNRQNPLTQRVIIVDEASMLGPTLYNQLMAALHPKAVIRFFGDNNQLPPVEEGTPPFINLLETQPMVELKFNYRSNDEIVANSMRVLRGSIPLRNPRFEIIYEDKPLHALVDFVRSSKDFTDGNHQIIMPTRRGNFGTMRVNPSLQNIYNGSGPFLLLDRLDEKEAKLTLRGNDKFLWVKNDYSLDMFNGDIGQVEWIDEETGTVALAMPDKRVLVPARQKTFNAYYHTYINYDPRKQVELGYAITTHKSQGSEFGTVIYCMTSSAPYNLNRRNFYTGITRARDRVFIITDRKAMAYSMRRG